MPRIPCRKFNLGDGMILIAATAVGFGIVRWIAETGSLVSTMHRWNVVAAAYAMPVIMIWSIGLFLIRLRQPRPAARRLFRQPGMAASVVAVPLAVAWCLPYPITQILGLWSRGDAGICLYCSITAGSGILAAWAVLAVSRSMRAESGWIDRLGIAVGLGWVILLSMGLVDIYLR